MKTFKPNEVARENKRLTRENAKLREKISKMKDLMDKQSETIAKQASHIRKVEFELDIEREVVRLRNEEIDALYSRNLFQRIFNIYPTKRTTTETTDDDEWPGVKSTNPC